MSGTRRILIADDDPHIVKLLSLYVEREGWTALGASNGEEALAVLEAGDVDLVVLDIMMPKLDGIRTCEEIRAVSRVPVIMLTARDREIDKIRGLDLGADDYITKPFSVHEALARIKAVLRRTNPPPEEVGEKTGSGAVLRCGTISMDCRRFEVRTGDREIRLTAKEFELLRFFLGSPGQVFTKEQLLRSVWKQEYGTDENTVMVHIRRLRKKIEINPDNPAMLTTVWGIGYRFEGTP